MVSECANVVGARGKEGRASRFRISDSKPRCSCCCCCCCCCCFCCCCDLRCLLAASQRAHFVAFISASSASLAGPAKKSISVFFERVMHRASVGVSRLLEPPQHFNIRTTSDRASRNRHGSVETSADSGVVRRAHGPADRPSESYLAAVDIWSRRGNAKAVKNAVRGVAWCAAIWQPRGKLPADNF